MQRQLILWAATVSLISLIATATKASAKVAPGDLITKDNAAAVDGLVSPGNLILVKQGMEMKIVPTNRIEWPPPYRAASEQYQSQVRLTATNELQNYVAGLPFPLVDPNDPQVADKVMWNFSFRPMYTDDIDMRFPEVASYRPGSGTTDPIGFFSVGHFAFYNNIGRIEVKPYPTDPDGPATGIRYRFGFFPFLEPFGIRGYGLVRYRHIDPKIEDNTWVYNPQSRRLRRQSPVMLSDAISGLPGFGGGGGGGGGGGMGGGAGAGGGSGGVAYANSLDPDSYFGFSANIGDFTYKFLGEKDMLACVHAENSPAKACPFDGAHTICPEAWEMRHLYVIEATAKPGTDLSIKRRIFYIDSEGWFITASDQFDRQGQLWKTLALYHTYRDRPVPDARIAIYPYKRIFQVGLADVDLQTGAASVVYMPGPTAPERECWYIDMGSVDKEFFLPQTMERLGH